MASELCKQRQREWTRTAHATSSRLTAAEKLKKLRTFKCQRLAGYNAETIIKRLKTSRETLRRWANELGFDLEGTLGAAKPDTLKSEQQTGTGGES